MIWSAHFPKDCPPSDSNDTSHRVYRFVRCEPPTSDDFLSYKEINPSTDFGEKECAACGLSVYTELADALLAQKHVPGMAKRLVAQGDLIQGDGKIKPTPAFSGESHHTWWRNHRVLVEQRFVILQPALVSR